MGLIGEGWMAKRLTKKLRGYQKAPRERFKLLGDKRLTIEELVLYEFGIAITDWDRTHETYGSFKASDAEIAGILGWRSRSTVCRYRKSLINKGFFEQDEEGWITPSEFHEWELRKYGVETEGGVAEIEQPLSRLGAKTERHVLKIQQSVSKIEQNRAQRPTYSLGSSKGKFNNRSSSNALTDEELDQISKAIDTEPVKNSLTALEFVESIVSGKARDK